MASVSNSLRRVPRLLLLLLAAIFYALHFSHLTADFPNHSPWMDWAKYTDEGWYGDAAIRHFLLGHWYVPGDFNPAAALPVWPLLEAIVFRFAGVSLVAARALVVAVFGATLVLAYSLSSRTTGARWLARRGLLPAVSEQVGGDSAAPAMAVLLLAVSPFCFVFFRLAILEPPLILFTLLALLTASFITPMPAAGPRPAPFRALAQAYLQMHWLAIVALGLLLPAMILTKTTALFLVPALAWMLFAATGYQLRTFLLAGVPGLALAGGIWLAYFALLTREHLLLDYRYLFSANAYTGITRDKAAEIILKTMQSGSWIDPILYPLAVALAVLVVVTGMLRWRRLRQEPLLVTLVLWAGGYAAFLAYHNNIQPRYYLVIAVPALMLVPLALERLLLPLIGRGLWRRIAFTVMAGGLLGVAAYNGKQTIAYATHPQYTLLNAARSIARYIAQDRQGDPTHSRLILSISGSDLTLMTGLPSICDDFGTDELADRVKRYQPGWYVAWNDIEDDKMDSLTPLYRVERVATFPAMDDPDRNEMILYKLEDAAHTPPKPLHIPPVPRRMQTRIGQQPTANQLEH